MKSKTFSIVLLFFIAVSLLLIAVVTFVIAKSQEGKSSPSISKQSTFEKAVTDKLSAQQKTDLQTFSTMSFSDKLKIALEKNRKTTGAKR